MVSKKGVSLFFLNVKKYAIAVPNRNKKKQVIRDNFNVNLIDELSVIKILINSIYMFLKLFTLAHDCGYQKKKFQL